MHDFAGHPFAVQLSRELARRGHAVLHLYSSVNKTPKGALARQADDPPGLEIRPLAAGRDYRRNSFVQRWRDERAHGALLAATIREWRPEVAIIGNTPLDVLSPAHPALKDVGARFVFWVQDLLGIASHKILRARLPVAGEIIGRYHIAMEKRFARGADALVLITDDFTPILRSWGVRAERLHVIENWGPLGEIAPRPRRNAWAEKNGLLDRRVFLYTGSMGLKHDPGLLVALARHLKGRADATVVVVSEGRGADVLAAYKRDEGLDSLRVFPFQPYGEMPDVLATGDVMLAVLGADAGVFSVPSKVLSYLCAGRPVLGAMPAENLAARMVRDNGLGVVVAPDDEAGFLAAADRLLADEAERARLGANAAAYAASRFDIGRISDEFEHVLTASRA
ncbi:MAG: glycosyltransferase family 4 protein [Alphaproteobacteria bacterium]